MGPSAEPELSARFNLYLLEEAGIMLAVKGEQLLALLSTPHTVGIMVRPGILHLWLIPRTRCVSEPG
jgi:hypothetical protein